MLRAKRYLDKLFAGCKLSNCFLKLLKFLVVGAFGVEWHNLQVYLAVVLFVQSIRVGSLHRHVQSLLKSWALLPSVYLCLVCKVDRLIEFTEEGVRIRYVEVSFGKGKLVSILDSGV